MPEATRNNIPGNDLIYRLPSHLYPPFIYRLPSYLYPPFSDLSPRPSLLKERGRKAGHRPHTETRRHKGHKGKPETATRRATTRVAPTNASTAFRGQDTLAPRGTSTQPAETGRRERGDNSTARQRFSAFLSNPLPIESCQSPIAEVTDGKVTATSSFFLLHSSFTKGVGPGTGEGKAGVALSKSYTCFDQREDE